MSRESLAGRYICGRERWISGKGGSRRLNLLGRPEVFLNSFEPVGGNKVASRGNMFAVSCKNIAGAITANKSQLQ